MKTILSLLLCALHLPGVPAQSRSFGTLPMVQKPNIPRQAGAKMEDAPAVDKYLVSVIQCAVSFGFVDTVQCW